jgi:hypothetical protein
VHATRKINKINDTRKPFFILLKTVIKSDNLKV